MNLILVLLVSLAGVQAVPHFYIDLDSPPRVRFTEIATHYRDQIVSIMTSWEREVTNMLGTDGIQQVLQYLIWPQEYLDEMQGIVDTVSHPVVTHDLVKLWNAMYELNHPTFCTGVVMAEKDGTVLHGRNLDYVFLFEEGEKKKDLDTVTHEITFLKWKQPLYYSVQWPAHIGIHTGMRFGAYSVNLNMRANRYIANLGAMYFGGMSHGIIIRNIMQNYPDFETAMEQLYQAKFAAPLYLVMAGAQPYQGAVLALDRNGQHFKTSPEIQRLNVTQWHLEQTNSDFNKQSSDIRRPFLQYATAATQRASVSENKVLKIVRTPPTFNVATKFTVVMNPKSSAHYVFLPYENAHIDYFRPPSGPMPAAWQPSGAMPASWPPSGPMPAAWQPSGAMPAPQSPSGAMPTSWQQSGAMPTLRPPWGAMPLQRLPLVAMPPSGAMPPLQRPEFSKRSIVDKLSSIMDQFSGMQRFLAPAPTAKPHSGTPVGVIPMEAAIAALQDPNA